jgi:murein DD-endopeptidase MepM/ murein hydrolase activator NlpD
VIFFNNNKDNKNRAKSRIFRLSKRPLQYFGHHRRALIVVAVILFVFLGLQYSGLGAGAKKSLIETQEIFEGTLIEERAIIEDPTGVFDALAAGFSSVSIPTAEASVDLSLDDEQENQDYAVMDQGGFLSPGEAGNAFLNIQRDPTKYIVQSGDSASSIAVKFGINTDTILWANNLGETDYIKPGQELLILPINGVFVKIMAKDTVASLAKKYKGKEEEIRSFNNLYDDAKLVAGNSIVIPDGEMVSVVAKPSSKVTAPKYAQNKTQISNWLISPTTGKNWGRLHGYNSVDVANACGTPIYAAAAGKVTLSDGIGWNYGYGKYIMIRHSNGVVTLYGHTSRILVEVGEQVEQGQLIALMGTTGRSSGCHLHFEVRGASNPLARR